MQMWNYTKEVPKWRTIYPPTDGIFKYMFVNHELPAKFLQTFDATEDVAFLMDNMAFSDYGQRFISGRIMAYYDDDDLWNSPSEGAGKGLCAELCWHLYHTKWEKLIDVAFEKYDPIHNFYDKLDEYIVGTEDETTTDDIDKTSIKIDTRDLVVSRLNVGSKLRMNDGTSRDVIGDTSHEHTIENSGVSNKDSHDNNIYAFNSTLPVGESTNGGSSSTNTTRGEHTDFESAKTNEHSDNLSQSDESQESMTQRDSGTVSSNETQTDDRSEVRDLDTTRERHQIRTGNIGNLSTQTLINQEIELWRWRIIKEILDDVKEFGTLPIYV